MTAYTVLKVLHVLLAIAAVGANMTYGLWLARAARDRQHLAFALRGVKVLDDRVANPAYVLLLVTGFAMLGISELSWRTPWILASLLLYVVVMVLGLAGYTPLLRRQIAALERGGPESAEYRRLAGQARRLGIALAVLVFVIVVLMVAKPTFGA